MRQVIKNIADLSKLGGGLLDEMFRQEMVRVTDDVIHRPGVDKARKLTIDILVRPIMGQAGSLESVAVAYAVNSGMPKQQSDEIQMLCGAGQLTFNDLSQDNIHQHTIDEVEEKKGK